MLADRVRAADPPSCAKHAGVAPRSAGSARTLRCATGIFDEGAGLEHLWIITSCLSVSTCVTICDMDDPQSQPPEPASQDNDDSVCWVCGGPTDERNCRIVCRNCGFTRDCSDP